MSTQTPTIAFFGATGGVVNSALVRALRAGRHVIALVRTPSKLLSQLEAQGLNTTTLTNQLTIITGNALDKEAVKKTLTANQRSHLVPNIITGLGAAPVLSFNWTRPWQFFTIDQPSLCGDSAEIILSALSDIYHSTPTLNHQKPRLTFVSTTGISNGPEDVPFGMRLLYHWILAVPHQDKRKMESLYRDATTGGNDALLESVIGVRPTLLTGGTNADEGAGLSKIRVGREGNPETGFTVSRADVGDWIWSNVLADEGVRESWDGEMVSLTS